ncbi:MAG TPA: glycoside hydrolase family 99-like domain-containing protein [Edaphobacter sp.]|nr:glycoside hydrolase family 99-like domain-containing protein [Edaphobacter sp.]
MNTDSPGGQDALFPKPPRLIAFYLPQFYPTPYNDDWWGKGFTEWTNVVQGRPHFKGHYQPHLPADLGFYDLRLPEAREAQAALAKAYGVHGFCYYHYWFNGKRILERPLNEVLASGSPALPFCVCWANEAWTRTWKGHQDKVLMQQSYSPEDDIAHIRHLLPTLSDQRYIKIDGKPLVLIYRIELLPNPQATADIWRREAEKWGLPGLFLLNVESNYVPGSTSPSAVGFDAAVRFQPNFTAPNISEIKGMAGKTIKERYPGLHRLVKQLKPQSKRDNIYDYVDLYRRWRDTPPQLERHFECVTPMWDNSARRYRGATIVRNSTPELYEQWLREAVNRSTPDSTQERTVFINAWNEWAEGCHLEPCHQWGHQYLEATRRVYSGG